VIADFSDHPTKNSVNHSANSPGENVGIGAGCVEWWDKPNGLYLDDDEGLPVELQTFIVQ
jgi:hypothetical protein